MEREKKERSLDSGEFKGISLNVSEPECYPFQSNFLYMLVLHFQHFLTHPYPIYLWLHQFIQLLNVLDIYSMTGNKNSLIASRQHLLILSLLKNYLLAPRLLNENTWPLRGEMLLFGKRVLDDILDRTKEFIKWKIWESHSASLKTEF